MNERLESAQENKGSLYEKECKFFEFRHKGFR